MRQAGGSLVSRHLRLPSSSWRVVRRSKGGLDGGTVESRVGADSQRPPLKFHLVDMFQVLAQFFAVSGAVKQFKTGRGREGRLPPSLLGHELAGAIARQEARPPDFFTAPLPSPRGDFQRSPACCRGGNTKDQNDSPPREGCRGGLFQTGRTHP
jgi:hypothetical protein